MWAPFATGYDQRTNLNCFVMACNTHNAGALFQAFLKRMDDRAKQVPMLEAETIDVSPPLAIDPQPIDNQGSA